MIQLKKNQKQLKEITNSEFIILAYRDKYNLPLNDERYINLSEQELELDLLLSKTFKDEVKKLFEEEEEETEDDIESIQNKGDNINMKLHSGFTEEEIDKFWNTKL